MNLVSHLSYFHFQLGEHSYPIGSMYGIFTFICLRNQPNVGKYTIHGSYGYVHTFFKIISKMPLFLGGKRLDT